MKENKIIKLGDIDVFVKECSRTKHIKLRASSIIELIVPKSVNITLARQFLVSKELWIRNQLLKIKPVKQEMLSEISILGEIYKITYEDPHTIPKQLENLQQGIDEYITEPIMMIGDQLVISKVVAPNKAKFFIATFLKKAFKKEVEKYAAIKAYELGVKYSRITVKDTISRWGSCSSTGNLSFSWRLILAPRNVMEYVIIHELCHLKEMNHSIRFWKLVESAFPGYKDARAWLKAKGRSLHYI